MGVLALSRDQTNDNVKITCIYNEDSDHVQNLLAESFAIFVDKETIKSYTEANGWLPVGGTICTQK